MTNFNVKTICKVSRNFEGLTENNLFIAFNALISLFCFFVSFGCFFFSFSCFVMLSFLIINICFGLKVGGGGGERGFSQPPGSAVPVCCYDLTLSVLVLVRVIRRFENSRVREIRIAFAVCRYFTWQDTLE